MSNTSTKPIEIARDARRFQITGVPKSSWYDLMRRGKAPRPIPLGGPSVGWLVSELEEWVEARKAERDATWRPLGDAAMKVIEKME